VLQVITDGAASGIRGILSKFPSSALLTCTAWQTQLVAMLPPG